jgi:hypothetical protein
MRAFWNVGRSCLASRTAHAPAPTPPNRPTARTFARPSTHGALKAARTLAGSRRLPHAHGRTGCRHVHPTSQHEAPGLMLCLENRPLSSDSFSTVLGLQAPRREANPASRRTQISPAASSTRPAARQRNVGRFSRPGMSLGRITTCEHLLIARVSPHHENRHRLRSRRLPLQAGHPPAPPCCRS